MTSVALDGRSERDLDQRKQCAVRVREGPHKPTCRVANVQIRRELQSVEEFESDTEG
jgi:hypothetical protein